MPAATIKGIACHLPDHRLDNAELSAAFPDWSVDKIVEKTGIRSRRIAAPGETSGDLAVAAARKLFASGVCVATDIDFLLLCTQTPDYFLPTTACLVQERLGVPTSAGAFDFNLGCSGFVYGLSVAKGLIETGQARGVLLVTAETYSKLLAPDDRTVRTVFGDAAAATYVASHDAADASSMGPFVFGTDGRGGKNLIVETGGFRHPSPGKPRGSLVPEEASSGHLYMNGSEIFTFTLEAVPRAVRELLARANLSMEDVDRFVFHQANRFMLEHLRKKAKIPPERFVLHLEDCGNTVSSTIPLALTAAVADGRISQGHRVMIVGFGVGYSWAAAFVRWPAHVTISM